MEFRPITQTDEALFHICAYGPAEAFWHKCGFRDSVETAKNGLKLMVKRKS